MTLLRTLVFLCGIALFSVAITLLALAASQRPVLEGQDGFEQLAPVRYKFQIFTFPPPPTPPPGRPYAITTDVEFPKEAKFIETQAHTCSNLTTEEGEQPTIVNLVATSVKQFGRRQEFRRKFKVPAFARRLFIVGRPVVNSNIRTFCNIDVRTPNKERCVEDEVTFKNVREEAEKFGDVVIGDFLDVYQNLTWKTFTMLHWKNKYCPQASMMMKHDEDIFLDYEGLQSFIRRSKPENIARPRSEEENQIFLARQKSSSLPWKEKTVWGNLHWGGIPMRNRMYRNFLPFDHYPADVFPVYPAGPGYVLTQPLVAAIVNATPRWLNIEDVWMGVATNGVGGVASFGPTTLISNELQNCESGAYQASSHQMLKQIANHIANCTEARKRARGATTR